MSTRTWHKGPPPHVGWWNANSIRSDVLWRWWNGKGWSLPSIDDFDPHVAARRAATPCAFDDIEWTDYWPENARVPRVNPNEVET
ncbi:hypothetical protein [Pandoraea commovens]|uniref:DUF2510 domain-containing protein n=1 Tax=Pandoraea commovens TaxID=2508289 RepID=A0A5E4SIW8_9BURK|nr:hypothetical protein [Pandoraea commovens]VVD75131.1 hypothetical protein PCO31010_00837 [Pandoraea commovens]